MSEQNGKERQPRRRNVTVTTDWEPDDIFEVLANRESRVILAAASVKPVSAQELEQATDASLPTIYRRLNGLLKYDLLSENQTVGPDGEQYKQYTTALEEIRIQIENGGFNVQIDMRKDTVDKFGELFDDLSEGQRTTLSDSQFDSFSDPSSEG